MTVSEEHHGPAHHTVRLAAALAHEHLHLHGPFVVHLCKRVVSALEHDPATLARLVEAVEALREAADEREADNRVRALEAERFGGVSRRIWRSPVPTTTRSRSATATGGAAWRPRRGHSSVPR